MDSMFDRLGELLHDALESGQIPQQKKRNCGTQVPQKIKEMPQNVRDAFDILGMEYSAAYIECRIQYHERLKMFHPDGNSSNSTVQKVASAKTTELIAAWKTISTWFEKIET